MVSIVRLVENIFGEYQLGALLGAGLTYLSFLFYKTNALIAVYLIPVTAMSISKNSIESAVLTHVVVIIYGLIVGILIQFLYRKLTK